MRKKPFVPERLVDEELPKRSHQILLLRGLNLIQTTFIGVGTALGGAMFVIIGRAAGSVGPGIVITFLIGALFSFLDSLSYSELGAAVPGGAGGAISFVRRAYGDTIPTFLAGWFDWMGSITRAAIGSIVFAFSVNYFLRWVEPFTLAVVMLLFFAVINFRGVKATAKIELILTIIMVILLVGFMASSSLKFENLRFDPFFPEGFLSTVFLISYVFPSYAGYETIAQLSEEVKTAGKTIPRALFLTLFTITIFFISTAIAMIGGAPPAIYANSDTPLQDAANYFMGSIGGVIMGVGSIIAALSTINGSMVGGTRISFALSRNNLLPPFFAKIHPKYKSPYTALLLTTLLAIIFVLSRSVDLIVYTISLGYIVTSIFVSLALLHLRKKEPSLYRPFKVPFSPYIPLLAISSSVFMLILLSGESLILGLVFSLIGLLYLSITRKIQKRQTRTNE